MTASPISLGGRVASWLRCLPGSFTGDTELEALTEGYNAFCRFHFAASPFQDGAPVGIPLSADSFADFAAHLRAHNLRPVLVQVSPPYESPPRYRWRLNLPAPEGSALQEAAAREAAKPRTDDPLPEMVRHWLRQRSVSHPKPIVARDERHLSQLVCQTFRQAHPGYGVNDLDILDATAHAMGYADHRRLLGSALCRSDGGRELRLDLRESVS